MSTAPGILSSLRGFATSSVALLRVRLGLLKVEAEEEAGRLLGLLLWSVAAVLLGVAGLVFFAVLLTVLWWDSHRLLALAVFATAFLGAAGFAISSALRLVRRGSQLFAASLGELRRDESALSASSDQRP